MPKEREFKFPECEGCVNNRRIRMCRQCDNGEFFEEKEPAGVDELFGI